MQWTREGAHNVWQIRASMVSQEWEEKWALHNGRMNCLHCASTKTSKNGHRRSKQCYICRDCGRQFLEIYDSIG